MSDDRLTTREENLEQLLDEIYRKYRKIPEPGDPPLESQPPSQRLVPHSPLNEQESNTIFWADCEWYGIKPAPPDHPIYQAGYSICFLTPLQKDALKRLRESERAKRAQALPKLEPD